MSMKTWLSNALDAADLMQNYVGIVAEKMEDLTAEELEALAREVQNTKPVGPEDAAALAIIIFLIENPLDP